jgi:hypothetical protein
MAVVLVMAADAKLEPIDLVAPLRRPVKDRLVAHQELDPTPPGPIGLVDDPVLQDESAEAGVDRQASDGRLELVPLGVAAVHEEPVRPASKRDRSSPARGVICCNRAGQATETEIGKWIAARNSSRLKSSPILPVRADIAQR